MVGERRKRAVALAFAGLLLIVLPSPTHAKNDRPAFALSADFGAGIGTYAPYAMMRLGFERRLFGRIDVGVGLHLNLGEQLFYIGPDARIAVIVHLSSAVDLALGGQVGYGGMRIVLPLASPWVSHLAFSSVTELRIRLPFENVELRAAPLMITAYWRRIWGLSLEPNIGLAYRF